jgi:hypothetical protein
MTTCVGSAKYRAGVGRPSTDRRSMSSGPGHPAPHRRRCQSEAAPGFQWGRTEPGSNSDTTPSDAGTIHHREAAYPGRAQESPRRCRGPTGRELCFPEAGVPPGASRRGFPIHAGSLGPQRANAELRACGPGSPRQRAPPPRPSSPPRREGAPRLPPQAEPRLPSPSTRGCQSQNCGSQTTDWPASWVGRTMTTSSSSTFPCSSPTLPEPGWSICPLRRSPTGTTWSKLSLATSRAHTCALGTPGISEATASSQENPSGTTSGDFRSSAPSCPTSPTRMSSALSSPAPLAATW